jgi:hypothetical protein
MRCWVALTLLLTAGCSTAPIADLMDHFSPSPAGAEVAAAKVTVVQPPVKVVTVMPKPPSGALPVITPGTVNPVLEPPPQHPPVAPPVEGPEIGPPPKPVAGAVVPVTFRPRIEPKDNKEPTASPKQDVAPALYRPKVEMLPVVPQSLPVGLGLPR